MTRIPHSTPDEAAERQALRRRVKRLYDFFNRGLWEKCFSLIDPLLREQSRVDAAAHAAGLRAFQEVYGSIRPWHVRISMHLDASSNTRDPRPFAYVYVIWQDQAHGFHMFRERWVKHSGRWYTRVVGLVPNRQETVPGKD